MGNWFSSCKCAKATNSECSLSQEKAPIQKHSLIKEKKEEKSVKRKQKNQFSKTKASRRSKAESVLQEKLSLTSFQSFQSERNVSAKSASVNQEISSTSDLTVIGHAIPVLEKPATPEMERDRSTAKVIAVQPSATSEHSSDGTLPDRRLKRPITGNQSNVSLSSGTGVKQSQNCQPKLADNNEESKSVLSLLKASQEKGVSNGSSQSQLLDILKVRLDMAINNMEINRLMANVERALDRSSRARELGLQRIRAARSSRRVYPVDADAQEETAAVKEEEVVDEDENFADGEETGDDTVTDGEETGDYDDETGEDSYSEVESETPPPPPLKPKICWQ